MYFASAQKSVTELNSVTNDPMLCAKLTVQHTYDMTPARLGAWQWGPLASTYGGSGTAFHCVPKSVPPEYSTVCGPGTLLCTFWGPRNGVPRVPPYFNPLVVRVVT